MHYTPVHSNDHNLSIRKQPLPMRRVICAAISHVSGDIVFDSAYPVAEKVEFETFYHAVLSKCSKCLKYFEIIRCIQYDEELV